MDLVAFVDVAIVVLRSIAFFATLLMCGRAVERIMGFVVGQASG